ncbi:MAG: TonB-dependent receptor [Acidobacteriaceae bacterium]
MTRAISLSQVAARPVLLLSLALSAAIAGSAQTVSDQHPLAPQGTVKDGYAIHQSIDLGGHIADNSGSAAMYDTLVNLQTGPRILNQTLDMRASEGSKHFLFDTLFANSAGYGGDPNDFTVLRMSKGRLYQFNGIFRRDRQYFDYDLLDNPLVPAGLSSNGYTFPQVENSPHLFNTVRRMTDVDLTFLPLSKVSFHAGYSQNVMEGPTFSSIHEGTEALLLQNWRNSTDTWRMGVTWKPAMHTLFGFDEVIEHYKGDTSWGLGGLTLQLSNGAPVSLGFDNTSVPNCGNHLPAIQDSTTSPATANPTCNGYLQYARSAPIRTLISTEEFHFQSSDIPKVQMNGRVLYTGATMNLPNYNESFTGLISRSSTEAFTVTGNGKAERTSVGADFGLVWQFARRFSLSEQYDFYDFRIPGTDNYLQTSYSGTSMLAPPPPTGTVSTTADAFFIGQKTETNTALVRWQAAPHASFSLGWRQRVRMIELRNPDASSLTIHTEGALLGAELQPLPGWKIYGNVEIGSADNAYIQIDPRQFQRYQLRTTYHPKEWATIFGDFGDIENRNNATYVHHLDHDRSLSAGADLSPNPHYGVDLSYGYMDFFTVTDECYTITPAATNTPLTSSPACIANGTPYYTNGYYDAPTQYGSFGLTFTPVTRFTAGGGYRMTAINGTTVAINALQVPGSLQSHYQTPYANAVWTVQPGWAFRADWNYYGYGEGAPIGPASPRNFRGNLYTLGMHYEF